MNEVLLYIQILIIDVVYIYIYIYIYIRENTSLDCYLKGFELSTQDEEMPFCDLYCLFSFSVGQNI